MIDETLTTTFSLHAMNLPWSPNWADYFGREAPLILEIGFGNGRFLVDLARQNPEANLIGIERAHSPLHWAEERLLKYGITNVRLINGEALMSLYCLFEPASVQTVHINFSDPWHKKRHHRRRLIKPEFLRVLTDRLQMGGYVYLATDIVQYAGEIGLALSQTAGLKNSYASPWMMHRENPTVITNYEQKAIDEGRPCHYFKWQRVPAPLAPIPVIQEESPMPNARLRLPYRFDKVLADFQPQIFRYEDRVIRLIQIYQTPRDSKVLLEVLLEEPLFSQRLMMELFLRDSGEYLLHFSSVGYPRATRGVHDAVYSVTEWLLGLDSEASLIEGSFNAPQN